MNSGPTTASTLTGNGCRRTCNAVFPAGYVERQATTGRKTMTIESAFRKLPEPVIDSIAY